MKKKLKCKFCGKEFTPTRDWQKFCNKKCQWKYWDKAHPRIKIGEQLDESL